MKKKEFTGTCHCKKIKFKFLCEDNVSVIECNCSICAHTRYLHLIVPHSYFTLLTKTSELTEYKFNTYKAKHFFCKICGIKSFYQPRSHPNSYSVNYYSIINPPKINNIIKFNGHEYEKNIDLL